MSTPISTCAARINGAVFALDGRTRPFAPERETKAEIGLTSVQLPHYLPYLTLPENLVVRSLQVADGNRNRLPHEGDKPAGAGGGRAA